MKKITDVVVAKEIEQTLPDGTKEKKIVWNKVGAAWKSKASDSISFELFMIPTYRFVINFSEKPKLELPKIEFKEL